MSWKARLDHLIADGEQATYLESREILEELLEYPAEERWKIILSRDPRLTRLVSNDYQWLLKVTATAKPSEVSEAASLLAEQWQNYATQLTQTLESSFAEWRNQYSQELLQRQKYLFFAIRWGIMIAIITSGFFLLRADSNLSGELPTIIPPVLPAPAHYPDLNKIIESSQAQWHQLVTKNSQELTQKLNSLQQQFAQHRPEDTENKISLWIIPLFVITAGIFLGIGLRLKTLPNKNIPRPPQELINMVESSQAHWGERLERRSEDLLNALENSQIQTQERLEQVLHDAAVSQERQRELLWRIMALEELGLKLIAGENFRAEFIALRSIWNESELLDSLDPNAIRGIPGRPLLLTMLEQIYGDILIQRAEHKTPRRNLWNFWFAPGTNLQEQFNKLEEQVARGLREIRRGNWLIGIEELADIKYAPIAQWTENARTRLRLEDWYSALRQKAWGQHLGSESKDKSLAAICFKTCRIPFCKTGKLCLKQLLLRFKKLAE